MDAPVADLGGSGPAASASSPLVPRLRLERQCLNWSRINLPSNQCIPPPRSGAASVVVKGKLYVFGGYGGGTGRLDDFYSFDFEKGQWEEVQMLGDERPGCRENNGVVISDSSKSIYLFGGYNGSSWLNDLWKFDIESKCWTCIQDSSDPGAGDEAVSVLGDLQPPPGGSAVRGKVPSRRFGYVSVVHSNKLVLFGGFDGSKWLNDMYLFDFATKHWTEIQASGCLPSVRSCPAWSKDDTHVYIQGGYDGVDRKSDFFACDLTTYTWTQMPCFGTPPSPRYFHSCCLYGSKMYVYGGYSGSERLADMYAYDFETNHWSEVDCTSGDAPSGRSSLVAQVYENCLYIFGGYNGSTVLNDFYRFRLKPIGLPPPALVNDFRRLIDNPDMADLSDITFVVEGKEVYAHRAILAVRSQYFSSMLLGGMRESVSRHGNSNRIELPDVSHAVFLKVLEFLYTDSVSSISLEAGIHLMIASERFMLDRLKSLCEDCIRRDIDSSNAIGILVASHQHNAAGLKDIALEFILNNLVDDTIFSGLSELKSEPDLLLELLTRKTLAESSNSLSRGGTSNQSPTGAGSGWTFDR